MPVEALGALPVTVEPPELAPMIAAVPKPQLLASSGNSVNTAVAQLSRQRDGKIRGTDGRSRSVLIGLQAPIGLHVLRSGHAIQPRGGLPAELAPVELLLEMARAANRRLVVGDRHVE